MCFSSCRWFTLKCFGFFSMCIIRFHLDIKVNIFFLFFMPKIETTSTFLLFRIFLFLIFSSSSGVVCGIIHEMNELHFLLRFTSSRSHQVSILLFCLSVYHSIRSACILFEQNISNISKMFSLNYNWHLQLLYSIFCFFVFRLR